MSASDTSEPTIPYHRVQSISADKSASTHNRLVSCTHTHSLYRYIQKWHRYVPSDCSPLGTYQMYPTTLSTFANPPYAKRAQVQWRPRRSQICLLSNLGWHGLQTPTLHLQPVYTPPADREMVQNKTAHRPVTCPRASMPVYVRLHPQLELVRSGFAGS